MYTFHFQLIMILGAILIYATFTVYGIVGHFHTHPFIYKQERTSLNPKDAVPSLQDKRSMVTGRAEIIVAILKRKKAKEEVEYVGNEDKGYKFSFPFGDSYFELILRAWKKPGNKNDELRIQCPYLEGIGKF